MYRLLETMDHNFLIYMRNIPLVIFNSHKLFLINQNYKIYTHEKIFEEDYHF